MTENSAQGPRRPIRPTQPQPAPQVHRPANPAAPAVEVITSPFTPEPAVRVTRPTPVHQPEPARPAPAPAPQRTTNREAPVAPPSRSQGVTVLQANEVEAVNGRINLNELLEYLVRVDGSDLHLSVGAPPVVRLNGDMLQIPGKPRISATALNEAFKQILTPAQAESFANTGDCDLSYEIEGMGRFRVNLMRQKGNPGGVFRLIPTEIRPLEALGLPAHLYGLAGLPRGLVLITGPTGSGKSTTLAALVDHANRTRSGHIITIEDPIEYIHDHRSCVVNQREVGQDTASFSEALRRALRQDPDIILIGEMRDLETISIALTAAETGHLVFATLHTQSAQDTINRMIDVFPADQQQQVRSQLAATLQGVVCQTLVKRKDGKGRVPACEVMVVTNAIATMIRKDDTHQINQVLQAGAADGNQTLNGHLAELVTGDIVSVEAAEEITPDITDLHALIEGKASRRRPVTFATGDDYSYLG